MSQEIDASPELMELVFFALDHGIGSVRASHSPLTPFLAVHAGGQKTLHRFATELLEEGVARARETARELGPETLRCALAHDGFVTVQGVKSDAILVEASERGKPHSVLFFQRYRPKKFLRAFTTLGNAVYSGQDESLFGPTGEAAAIEERFQEWLFQFDDALEEFLDGLSPENRSALDGSPGSLDVVESLLLDRYPDPAVVGSMEGAAPFLDGVVRYVGDTFREILGGTWTVESKDASALNYRLPLLAGLGSRKERGCPHHWIQALLKDRTRGQLRSRLHKLRV